MSTLTTRPRGHITPETGGLPVGLWGATLSLSALILGVGGFGLLSLSCLLLAGAALMPGRGSLLRDLPAAVVLGVAGVLVMAQVAAVPGAPLLRDTLSCRLLLCAAALTLLGVASRRRGRKRVGSRTELLGSLPFFWLVAIATVGWVLPRNSGDAWYLAGGSDNVTHLVGAIRRAQTGFLDYGTDPYPGAWASVTAVISTATTRSLRPGPAVLMEWIGISSAAVWLLFAVVTLSAGHLAMETTKGKFAGPEWRGFLGFASAATLLGGAFWGFTVPWGFQTHILASLCVLVAVLETHRVVEYPLRTALVVTACGLVSAHSWTLAVPFILVPWCYSAWYVCIKLRRRAATAVLGLTVSVAVVSVAPLLLAVQSSVGVAHAGAVGAAAAVPWGWVLAGVACTAALWWGERRGTSVLPWTVGLGLAVTILLTVKVGAKITDYYPSKMLWLVAVLAVPAVWRVGATVASAMFDRLPPNLAGATRRTILTAVLVYAALNVATPPMGVFNTDVQRRGSEIFAAASSPHAADAQVVWKAAASPLGDAFVRFLLDYYAPLERQTPIALLGLSEECRLLQEAPHPAVLTRRTPSEVRERYSCVRDFDIVHTPYVR